MAAVLLILYLPACHVYITPQGVTPQEYIATEHPNRVRLTLNDMTQGLHRLELVSPSVGPADSLSGLSGNGPVTVSLNTLERFEVRVSNPGGTLGLVTVAAAAVGIGIYIGVKLAVGCALSPSCN